MYITEENLIHRNNNFNLLRLLSAWFVFVTHGILLGRYAEWDWLRITTGHRYSLSTVGLITFFTMSGFLVCRSLVNAKSLTRYLRNRFLRLWPAYAVCIALTILVIGTLYTTLPIAAFFKHPQTWHYLVRNISLLSTTFWLPGVFDNTPINPSAWTIPVEARLYLLLMILFLVVRRRRFRPWAAILFIALWLANMLVPANVQAGLLLSHWRIAISLALYFLAGACFYLYKEKIPLSFPVWLALFAYWLILLIWFPGYLAKAQHPFFVYSVFWIAIRCPKLPFFKADISYGFYLYAAPIQIALYHTAGYLLSYTAYFLITGASATLMAILSWHFIEKKALRFKHRPFAGVLLSRSKKAQQTKYRTNGSK